jgi:hypothetical protein
MFVHQSARRQQRRSRRKRAAERQQIVFIATRAMEQKKRRRVGHLARFEDVGEGEWHLTASAEVRCAQAAGAEQLRVGS